MRTLISCLFFLLSIAIMANAQNSPPIYVTLWFDTEDYILPQSDDAAKRVAEMLTRLGIKATFKVVGEKARTLERRGRHDVIAALKKHEIGYHSDTHSQQPTIAVYLQHTGWEDGAAEFYRREGQGVRDIERIFGVMPTCYGQPGASWAAQAFPALKRMGVGMYLDEGDHIGVDEQPFFFCGMLNVFKMGSNQVRMALSGGASLTQGKTRFQGAYDNLRARGGGTLSIYYHPCEWVHTEFWDGVNFSRGANPTRSEWKLPGTRPAQETEKAFADFEEYVKFIKTQPGVRFVTASELMTLYADRTVARSFSRAEILALAQAMQQEITFQRFDAFTLSAADAFALLNEAMNASLDTNELPAAVKLTTLYGPAHAFTLPRGRARPASFNWHAFAEAVRKTAAFYRTHNRMPDEIWFGVDSLAPQDYLVTLAAVIEELGMKGSKPEQVRIREGRFTSDKYIAADSTKLWGWVIFPEGFQAPGIVELARLQAWTLKPAMLQK
ncbi:MAG: polysaccharide deacetylase family protein [Acidobacteriota bacterium]